MIKVAVNYDFTQKELIGEREVFEVENGTKLRDLLQIIDVKIMNLGENKGIETNYKTTLANGQLNGCVVFINGSAPENLLEQELHDGDKIEFIYGFCGG